MNSSDFSDRHSDRLGDHLRDSRERQSMSVEKLSAETKISPGIIRAMETGNYTALPADAFARGFYALYAKALGLNTEQIISWYSQERLDALQENNALEQSPSAIQNAMLTHNMAKGRRAEPLTTFLLLLLLLTALAAGVLWYFQINPLVVLKEKIHIIQTQSVSRPVTFRLPPDLVPTIKRAAEKKKISSITSVSAAPPA